MSKKTGVIKVLKGIFSNAKGKAINTLAEALAEEAKCGCGIDCCKGVITLWDQDDPTKFYEISIASGAIVVTPK